MTDHDPLCVEALRTNRELTQRVADLERELDGRPERRVVSLRYHTRTHGETAQKLAAARREIRELRASPWTFLPWRGYVA